MICGIKGPFKVQNRLIDFTVINYKEIHWHDFGFHIATNLEGVLSSFVVKKESFKITSLSNHLPVRPYFINIV